MDKLIEYLISQGASPEVARATAMRLQPQPSRPVRNTISQDDVARFLISQAPDKYQGREQNANADAHAYMNTPGKAEKLFKLTHSWVNSPPAIPAHQQDFNQGADAIAMEWYRNNDGTNESPDSARNKALRSTVDADNARLRKAYAQRKQ